MPTKRRILLLITNLGVGGAQRVFSDHSRFLSKRYDIAEVVFDKAEAEDMYATGNPKYSLDVGAGGSIPGKIAHFRRRAQRLCQLISREKFEVCISHMDGANWVNVASRSRAKKILVVHGTVLHDHAIHPAVAWLRKRFLIPYLYNRAHRVVAVSEGIAHELRTVCGVKSAVSIPNFFDLPNIRQQAAEAPPAGWQQLLSEHPVLVTSGRLHEQKKQADLLSIFRETLNQRPGLKLLVLGDGPLRESLLEKAAALKLRTHSVWSGQPLHADYDVYFAGYVQNPFQLLHRSALFVFPSGWEGFPLALCEAMVSGVPVLSADCPTGPREILAPGTFDNTYSLSTLERAPNGYLLPMTNKAGFEKEWAAAIVELLADAERRKALVKSAERKMEEYGQSVIEQRWFDLVDALLP